jgi:tetratricopeptide (TPR) repeat protein
MIVLMWTAGTGFAAAQGFGGRVVAGIETSDVLVRLERQGGQILAQALTDGRGVFRFQEVSAGDQTNERYLYLRVDHEGYKPYLERLDATLIRGGGNGVLTIYLEPESTRTNPEDGTAVDVGQLRVEIPEEAAREYERALEDIEDGDHDDAAERLERVVELAPAYYDAWIDLGGAFDVLDRRDDARTAYEQALEVNPNGALALVNLGILQYREAEGHAAEENAVEAMGSFTEAQTFLEQAVALDPISINARFYLGATFYRLTRYDEAESQLTTAVDLGNGFGQARLMLINVYSRTGRYADALTQADAFIDENPDAPERLAIERVKSQIEAALDR